MISNSGSLAKASDFADCASVVWFDPGLTTGMAVLSVDPDWLCGEGESGWAGLGRAVEGLWHAQCGRHSRVWSESVGSGGAALNPRSNSRNYESKMKKRQRSEDELNHDLPPGPLDRILEGNGLYGGAEPTTMLRDEILQVVDCQNLLDNWPDAAWGYEDFILRQMNTAREFISPVRIFSQLAYSEIVHGRRARIPFVQSASTAKSTATDERMQTAGLYRPGMIHANDAMRHASTFMRRCRADAEYRTRAWPALFGDNGER